MATAPQQNTPSTRHDHGPVAERHSVAIFLMLSLIGVLLYANTLNYPFIYDSVLNISQNQYVRMTDLTSQQIAQVKNSPSPRPFSAFTFALNYYFHQYQPPGYHLVNIFIHVITALLVFLVFKQTLRRCDEQADLLPALAGGLLWMIHPLHTQSITYLVQRMNLLAAMFYLLAMYCYIKARTIPADRAAASIKKGLWLAAVIPVFILGMASKQIVATLPLALLTYEWFFFQKCDLSWLKKQAKWIAGAAFILLLFAFIYLGDNPAEKIMHGYARRGFTLSERLLTQPSIVIFYISLLFFPHPDRLMLLYDFSLSKGLLTPPTTTLAIAAIIILIIGAAVIARRHRLMAFAIIWFFLNLIIESSVLSLQLVFEHRTYLPSIFLFIACTQGLKRYLRPQVFALALLLLICASAMGTWQRNQVWRDRVVFWRDNVTKAPQVADVHNNLGHALLEAGNTEQAMAHFRQAIQIDPKLSSAHVNLGVALHKTGQTEAALRQYKKALALAPGDGDARYNLAMILKKYKKIEAAATHFKKILATAPFYGPAAFQLGLIQLEKKNYPAAIDYFRRAQKFDPENSMTHNNIGICLQEMGDTPQAIEVYQQGLRINEDNALLHNSFGLALMSQQRDEEATAHFKKAIQINPEKPEPYNNLGLIARHRDNIEEARLYFQQALQRDPDFTQAHLNLSEIWIKKRAPHNALPHLNHILRQTDDNPDRLTLLAKYLAACDQYEQAVTILNRLAIITPEKPVVFYNLACLYARQHKTEQALTQLRRAIDNGYNKWDHIRRDSDLDSIRHTEAYQVIMERDR